MTVPRLMQCYASHTGTGRNREALLKAGWGMLVSRHSRSWWAPSFERDLEGFPICLDPGAWTDHNLGRPFDGEMYERLIDKWGARADFVIAPDIVAGGCASLELSVRWTNRIFATGAQLILIPVQDGMMFDDLRPLVGPRVGIFMGGSTEWKLSEAVAWGRFCHQMSVHYHVARVNTLQRFILAHDAGATSVDGTSATRFQKTLELLERGRHQGSLIDVRREVA